MAQLVIQSNRTVTLPDDDYDSDSFSNVTNAIIQAQNARKAVIVGPEELRLNDSCANLAWRGIKFAAFSPVSKVRALHSNLVVLAVR